MRPNAHLSRSACDRGIGVDAPAASYPAAAPAALRLWKHSRQKTGRPWVGRNGTVVSRPHWEQTAEVSTRPAGPPRSEGLFCLFSLHVLHRFGSFLKFFSW